MNQPDMELLDEQLTAYLDGELSADESLAVERSLVHDERMRLRMVELRRAYEMLDEIPETPHSQRFTKSTLELVIKDVVHSPASDESSGLQRS
jgi:anti-sigma factor RsiW